MSLRDWAALERERRELRDGLAMMHRRAPRFGATCMSAQTWSNNKAPGAPFARSSLALTIWNKPAYGGSPWAGSASAGSSGSRSLSEATNPPAVGATLGTSGLAGADFDGTNDQLTNGTAISTLLSASAWSIWAIVNLDAIDTNDTGSPWLNDAIAIDTGTFWSLSVRSNGGAPRAQAYQWDGAAKVAEAAIGLSTVSLICAKYDGANISIRVRTAATTGAWSSNPAGNITTVTGTLRVGQSVSGAVMDGRLWEIATAATAFSDSDFDNVVASINADFGTVFL
jgi:hypothetical protein